jgi:hypothetical protein
MRWRSEILVAATAALVCLGTYVVVAEASAAATTSTSAANKNDVTRQAALAVGVKPPSQHTPRFVKRLAWRVQKYFLQLVSWLDPCSPPDSKLSLRVLWWKAIAANDASSPVYEKDDSLTYDMLPFGFRWLVSKPIIPFYPRWTHVIIEIRTAYLDQVICRIRREHESIIKLRLVSLGAGYDVRSVKLLQTGMIDKAVELDLPQVIAAKQKLFERLCRRRRPTQTVLLLPTFHAVNLTHVKDVETTLQDILRDETDNTDDCQWFTIFLFEGVLMYLPPGVPSALLRACRQALHSTSQNGCIIFADALENIPHDDAETAQLELARYGWNVTEWLPKGGRTRHMGRLDMLPSG